MAVELNEVTSVLQNEQQSSEKLPGKTVIVVIRDKQYPVPVGEYLMTKYTLSGAGDKILPGTMFEITNGKTKWSVTAELEVEFLKDLTAYMAQPEDPQTGLRVWFLDDGVMQWQKCRIALPECRHPRYS